jgi:ribose transport system permease protein
MNSMTTKTPRRAATETGGTPEPHRNASAGVLGTIASKYALVFVALTIVIGFSIAIPETYPTLANAQTIASNSAVVAFLALAAMMPLVTGQFDVSLGYQLGLSQTLCAGLMVNEGWSWPVAVAAAIGACLVVGLVNGLLVTRLNLASFIVTLGVGTVVYGLTQMYSGDQTILGTLPTAFTNAGRSTIAEIPLPFLYVVIAVAILWIALEYTSWGRACVATGGNPRAARLSGVRTDRAIVQSFVCASLLAGISGVISVMLLGASAPTVGLGELLPAFAGAFLGATAFRPGRFNSLGTFVAVYMLAAGIAGLQQLGAHFYVQQLFNGTALLLAVSIAAIAARRTAPRTT